MSRASCTHPYVHRLQTHTSPTQFGKVSRNIQGGDEEGLEHALELVAGGGAGGQVLHHLVHFLNVPQVNLNLLHPVDGSSDLGSVLGVWGLLRLWRVLYGQVTVNLLLFGARVQDEVKPLCCVRALPPPPVAREERENTQ